MDDSPFPVLLLPYLAICNVLDLFNLRELIHFSFCSKRTQRIASRKPKGRVEIVLKTDKQSEFEVRLNDSDTYKFRICGMSRNFLSTQIWKPTPIAGMIVPTKTIESDTATYWTDALQGIDQIGTYLTELLKTPITEIQFLSEKKDNDAMGIIDSVKSRQNTVGKCSFGQMKYTDRYLTHLLNNLEITDDFNLTAMPSPHFLYPWSLNCVRLSAQHGEWLTVEHLLNMTCQYVEIRETKISNEDLKRFLEHWQNGGFSSLKYLLLNSEFFDRADITEGMEVEEIPNTVWRRYLGHNGETIRMPGGNDIKRNDGTIRTVFFKPYYFEFAVRVERMRV
ncbi:unnamed protein product [Caenorhabditis brenneri]